MTPTASTRIAGFVLIVLLSLLAVWRSAIGTAQDGFSIDEAWHIVAGTSYARGEGYHLNPEHPPLVKRWVGAWMPDSFKLRPPQPLKEKEEERRWVQETMYQDNVPAAAQAVSRPAMWTLNGLLLCVLGLLLWRVFGLAWAAGTLAFLALEPTVAAHMPVVMTDLPLGLTLAIAALCTGLLATTWRWRWAVATGLAMGLALTAKHSALAGLAGLALMLVAAAAWGLHTPLVRGCDGEKLSKQHGAAPLELDDPVAALGQAAAVLGLPPLVHPHNTTPAQALAQWVKAWAALYNRAS